MFLFYYASSFPSFWLSVPLNTSLCFGVFSHPVGQLSLYFTSSCPPLCVCVRACVLTPASVPLSVRLSLHIVRAQMGPVHMFPQGDLSVPLWPSWELGQHELSPSWSVMNSDFFSSSLALCSLSHFELLSDAFYLHMRTSYKHHNDLLKLNWEQNDPCVNLLNKTSLKFVYYSMY